MKYFMIAGEASGDIHGAQLIGDLRAQDAEAQFCFLGGDMMAVAAGVAPLIHYRDMAFMGFIEVIKHLGSILGFMRDAKRAMLAFNPDALILIDYPSFNLKMAEYAFKQGIPVFYFISPKVWAWKEYRVKAIKKYVSRLFSILPFEVEFYRGHNFEVDYVGNPTVKEIAEAARGFSEFADFARVQALDPQKQIIALVPGSRCKEIRDNLPTMVEAALRHDAHCQAVIAGAPGVDDSLYRKVLAPLGVELPVLHGKSFELVHHARVAVVTSGTATLEAAILRTPQVACYRMNGSKRIYHFYRRLLHGKYVTLPNLITDDEVIPELLLHFCTADAVDAHLSRLLPDGVERRAMLEGYERLAKCLTDKDCTAHASALVISFLKEKRLQDAGERMKVGNSNTMSRKM